MKQTIIVIMSKKAGCSNETGEYTWDKCLIQVSVNDSGSSPKYSVHDLKVVLIMNFFMCPYPPSSSFSTLYLLLLNCLLKSWCTYLFYFLFNILIQVLAPKSKWFVFL